MQKIEPKDEEYLFDGRVIISQSDKDGIITFANRKFCEVSSYSIDELLGKPHSILKHPDMPKALFKEMWSSLKDGQMWNGIVKNIRRDGMYYWFDVEISPTYNEKNELTGYISINKQASQKSIKQSENLYKKMISKQEENQ